MPRPQFSLRSLFYLTAFVAEGCLAWQLRGEWWHRRDLFIVLAVALAMIWAIDSLLLRLTRSTVRNDESGPADDDAKNQAALPGP
jgi:hypothetical protein